MCAGITLNISPGLTVSTAMSESVDISTQKPSLSIIMFLLRNEIMDKIDVLLQVQGLSYPAQMPWLSSLIPINMLLSLCYVSNTSSVSMSSPTPF